MMHRLRPPMLDNLGLVETLRGEVDAWQSRQPDIAYSLAIGQDLDQLGEQLNMTLYRIVQECLTNIAKHAAASRVDVELHRVEGGATGGQGRRPWLRSRPARQWPGSDRDARTRGGTGRDLSGRLGTGGRDHGVGRIALDG